MQTTKSTPNTNFDLKEAFALWEKKKGDKVYYTGKTAGDEPINIVAFVNVDKKSEKQPDINIVANLDFDNTNANEHIKEVRENLDEYNMHLEISETIIKKLNDFFTVKIEKQEIRDVNPKILAITMFSILFEYTVLLKVY